MRELWASQVANLCLGQTLGRAVASGLCRTFGHVSGVLVRSLLLLL